MIGPEEADQRPIRSIEKPVPFDKVRLVFPLPDKETGVTRDVIVKELVHARLWFEKGKASWKRVIPGLNVTVPWPRVEPQEFKDHPGDTLRFEVETRTFMPTLLSPPMPGSVIDELRNRFSKFRTRHDAWYIEKKEAEEAEEQAKKRMAKEMRTPLKEIHAKERAANRAKGNKVMSADLKEKIGRLIAQKRQLMMDAAGVEKVAA
jgi:large subunit ribosomal protein L24